MKQINESLQLSKCIKTEHLSRGAQGAALKEGADALKISL